MTCQWPLRAWSSSECFTEEQRQGLRAAGAKVQSRPRLAQSGPLTASLAASLLLFGAYGLKYPAALNGPRFLAGSFLKQPFQVEGGALRVPTGAGLGRA